MNNTSMLAHETVVHEGKLHWGIFFIPAILCFFGVGGAAGLIYMKHAVAAGILGLAALAVILPSVIRYKTNGLTLTNRRVISRTGILSRRSIDLALGQIEGVSVEQSLIGQMLDFGTVVVRGTGGGIEKFPRLGSPAEFTRQLHEQLGRP